MGKYLFILKLNNLIIAPHGLVSFIHTRLKEFWQREPLACHLISISRIHELVVIDAVWCVAFYAIDGRLAGVEGEDVVDQSLTRGTERE